MRDFKGRMRNIIKTAVFFAVLLLLLLGVSAGALALAKGNDDLVASRNKSFSNVQKEAENTLDILVLGDSESFTTVSPIDLWKNYGYPCFICGQSGQKIQESYYILKTALKKQNPKVVLLETNVLYRKEEGTAALQSSLSEFASYSFPVLRFHDMWKQLLTGTTCHESNFKGFMIRTNVEAYEGGSYMQETEEEEPVEGAPLHWFKKIVRLCREKGIQLILYSSPSPVNYNYKKHNGLQKLADQYSLEYLDLNLKLEEIGIDWAVDTLDKGDHLNISGAEKVTKYLGDYLSGKYGLTDRRQETAYQSWNQEAEVYAEDEKTKILAIRENQ